MIRCLPILLMVMGCDAGPQVAKKGLPLPIPDRPRESFVDRPWNDGNVAGIQYRWRGDVCRRLREWRMFHAWEIACRTGEKQEITFWDDDGRRCDIDVSPAGKAVRSVYEAKIKAIRIKWRLEKIEKELAEISLELDGTKK